MSFPERHEFDKHACIGDINGVVDLDSCLRVMAVGEMAVSLGSIPSLVKGSYTSVKNIWKGGKNIIVGTYRSKKLDDIFAYLAKRRTIRTTEIGDDVLKKQIRDVVKHFDNHGRPPNGVLQGRRPGKPRGEFQNDGIPPQLPPRREGYYTEMDIWPARQRRLRGVRV